MTENHERTLRRAAITAISPPVFGLDIVRLGDEGNRCVAVLVPASVDGPHLIYRNDFFGAPVRNNADTVYMKESQIEAAYRTRFNERRASTEALDRLYDELAAVTKVESRAWLIAVGRPRVGPATIIRWDQAEARRMLREASTRSPSYASWRRIRRIRPFEVVDLDNPRPGLRRWVALRSKSTNGDPSWKDARLSVHFNGSVALAFALGGHKSGRDSHLPNWQFDSAVVEAAIADFMGLVLTVGLHVGSGEYEVRIGIEHGGPEQMIMQTVDSDGFAFTDTSIPMHRFTAVEATVTAADDDQYFHQVRVLIQDCVNQGGITYLQITDDCHCQVCSESLDETS